jgi:hypothetical protein
MGDVKENSGHCVTLSDKIAHKISIYFQEYETYSNTYAEHQAAAVASYYASQGYPQYVGSPPCVTSSYSVPTPLPGEF